MSNYNGMLKNSDTNYTTDLNQMGTLGIQDIEEYYWLASRDVASTSSRSGFYVRGVNANSDTLNSYTLCYVMSRGYTNSHSETYGLRPIFHLKSNIKVTGGTGEEGDPYILGT